MDIVAGQRWEKRGVSNRIVGTSEDETWPWVVEKKRGDTIIAGPSRVSNKWFDSKGCTLTHDPRWPDQLPLADGWEFAAEVPSLWEELDGPWQAIPSGQVVREVSTGGTSADDPWRWPVRRVKPAPLEPKAYKIDWSEEEPFFADRRPARRGTSDGHGRRVTSFRGADGCVMQFVAENGGMYAYAVYCEEGPNG